MKFGWKNLKLDRLIEHIVTQLAGFTISGRKCVAIMIALFENDMKGMIGIDAQYPLD